MTAIGDSTPVKTCTKCGECKPATTEFFYKHSGCVGGLNAACKQCKNNQSKQWAESNRLKSRAIKRAWKDRNPEQVRAQANRRRSEDAERVNARQQAWREKNAELLRQKARIYMQRKLQADGLALLRARLRARLHKGLARVDLKKARGTAEALGCSFSELRGHIERQFLKGMTWENRSEWHIDHIVPLATAKTEEDVIRLNHFTNLRPIWAKDNLSKGAQITHLI